MAKLTAIIPCFNNEASLPILSDQLAECEKQYLAGNPIDEFEYIFIDDGSKDNTFNLLLSIKKRFPEKVKIVKLSGNFGSLNALLAGFHNGTGDCYVTISADLQEPTNLIFQMYDYWKKGIKVVIAQRASREDPFLTRIFSKLYHSMIRRFALPNAPSGGFDMILVDKKIQEELIRLNESNTNILYLILLLKYPYLTISYNRKKRMHGKSSWTPMKKIKLFVDSFVAFSFFPIRLISITGLLLGLISFLYGIFVIYAKISGLIPLQGWSALMVVLLFVSSFQMIALGIIGEYVWRALDASRKRPNFIIEKTI
ncbi:MAG: glycosyltransferase family 2 protein [Bacteroidota bacterium]